MPSVDRTIVHGGNKAEYTTTITAIEGSLSETIGAFGAYACAVCARVNRTVDDVRLRQ